MGTTALCWTIKTHYSETLGADNFKLADAEEAKNINTFTNAEFKLLQTNAAIWFNNQNNQVLRYTTDVLSVTILHTIWRFEFLRQRWLAP
jgi:hypothetical protein